jgi:hypothetical protein
VLYADGGNPNTSPTLYTGGGQCGCSDSSQCNGLYACQNAGYYGTCQPTCSYVNGVDSCTPQQTYPWWCPNNYYPGPYCNTYTGACQQCLDDYDCTSKNCNVPICNNGTCVGCITGDDCQTFPNNSCYYNNCNTYCSDNSQCPTDGGYTCQQTPNYYGNACLISCVMGDDAGMGTVSDAGNPCPTDAPLCVPNPNSSITGGGVCAQNFPCDYNTCSNPSYCTSGCGYGYCTGWDSCYQYPYCFC